MRESCRKSLDGRADVSVELSSELWHCRNHVSRDQPLEMGRGSGSDAKARHNLHGQGVLGRESELLFRCFCSRRSGSVERALLYIAGTVRNMIHAFVIPATVSSFFRTRRAFSARSLSFPRRYGSSAVAKTGEDGQMFDISTMCSGSRSSTGACCRSLERKNKFTYPRRYSKEWSSSTAPGEAR